MKTDDGFHVDAEGTCPVVAVMISSDGKADRVMESLTPVFYLTVEVHCPAWSIHRP